ncbi:unnamed protein product, partial [Symbiodinium sp. CCMP2456]
MKLEQVAAACTAEQLEALDKKLTELDAKRKKDKAAAEKDDGSDQEVPDENFGEMDDPAAHFAQQRLQEIEEEEENEPEEDTGPAAGGATAEDGGAASSSGATAAEGAEAATAADEEGQGERLRESRRALSSVDAVPAWLAEKYEMPSSCMVVHVVHTGRTLPHFQVRLGSGRCGRVLSFARDAGCEFVQLRASTSASYNPAVDAASIETSKDCISKLAAKKRSQLQAWYMCWTWAMAAESGPKKRRT